MWLSLKPIKVLLHVCHDPFPELSPMSLDLSFLLQVHYSLSPLHPTGPTNQSQLLLTLPLGPPVLHSSHGQKPSWNMQQLVPRLWMTRHPWSCGHHVMIVQPHVIHACSLACHLSQQTWELRVLTLVPLYLFLLSCFANSSLMAPSCYTCTSCHS